MSYKYLNHYLIFIILNQLFLLVNRVNGQFTPGPQVGHEAVLVGKKLYFIGGRNFNKEPETTSAFFYYDFGEGIRNAGFVDLRSQGINLPYTIWHTANIGGANQDSIFIMGGTAYNETNLVYQFDTKTNIISTPKIQGITPPRRQDMDSVSYGGKIYMFSGRMTDANGVDIFFDNFDILDTINLNWEVGSSVNAPSSRYLYTATLSNGTIYYLGGIQKNDGDSDLYIPLTDIYLYDINTNTWSLEEATLGNVPGSRIGHSAVLIGGKICVYGGVNFINGTDAKSSDGTIALFDTATFTWSIPQLENINTPKLIDTNIPKLVYHTATALDKLMFVTFGNFSDTVPRVINENYYVFDLGQTIIQWFRLAPNEIGNPKDPASNNTNTTNPSPPTSSTSPTSDANTELSLSKPIIIGLSTGLAVILLGVPVILLMWRSRRARRRKFSLYASGRIPPQLSGRRYSNSHDISPTPTLTQSQDYSPGQESATLPKSSKSSTYFPGTETPPPQ